MSASSFRLTMITTASLLLALASKALAGVDFMRSCKNYYVGNGISDSTGELFIEAWCQGGIGGGQCTRLKLSECFQNLNGELQSLDEDGLPPLHDILETCDIPSCAMRGDVWDEPVLSCYCQDQNGEWDLTSINLDDHIGSTGGILECGSGDSHRVASTECPNPLLEAPPSSEGELR